MAESETSSSVEVIEVKEKRGSPFSIFKDFKLPLNFPPVKQETEEVESRGEASETKAPPNVVRVPVPDVRRDFPSLKLEAEEEEQGGPRNMWQEMEAILKYSGDLAPAGVSNRSLFVEAILKIRAKSEGKGKRKILLQKTCFGRLIYDTPNDIKFSGNMVHHLLLREVPCPHVDEVWVLIGGQVLKFGLYEFQSVTGLKIGEGDLHKASEKPCTISTKLFNSKRRISKGEIESIYENLETDDDALFVKMSLIYLLELGLLGKDKKTLVDYRHLQLVDNLKKFNKYPWGRVSCEVTIGSLKKALHRWQDARKPIGSMSYSVLGFPYAFQVWAYECIPRLGQQFAVKRSGHREGNPLIFNWSSRLAPSFEILDRVLRETSLIAETIPPISEEVQGDNLSSDVPKATTTHAMIFLASKRAVSYATSLDALSCRVDEIRNELRSFMVEIKEDISVVHAKMVEILARLSKALGDITGLQDIPKPLSNDGDEESNARTDGHLSISTDVVENAITDREKRVCKKVVTEDEVAVDGEGSGDGDSGGEGVGEEGEDGDWAVEVTGDALVGEGNGRGVLETVFRDEFKACVDIGSVVDVVPHYLVEGVVNEEDANMVVEGEDWNEDVGENAKGEVGDGRVDGARDIAASVEDKKVGREERMGSDKEYKVESTRNGNERGVEDKIEDFVLGVDKSEEGMVEEGAGNTEVKEILHLKDDSQCLASLVTLPHASSQLINKVKEQRLVKRAIVCHMPCINPTRKKAKSACPKDELSTDSQLPMRNYDPDLNCPKEALERLRSWIDSQTNKEVDINYCQVGRDWFNGLLKDNMWLDNTHIDACTWWLRRRLGNNDETTPWVSVVDLFFGIELRQLWTSWAREQEKKKKKSKFTIPDPGCKLIEYAMGWYPPKNPCRPFGQSDKVVFGLNVRGSHWVAIELNLKDHIVRVYNSMSTFFARWETELQFLTCGIDAVLGPIGKASPNGVWSIEHPHLPQQTGGGDCGMFTMMYLEYLCYGKDPNMITQEKISEFRRKKAVDFFQLGEVKPAKHAAQIHSM